MWKLSRKEAFWRRGARWIKRREGELRNVKNAVGLFGTGNRKCQWRTCVYPKRENEVVFTTLTSVAVGAVQNALGVGGRCREIF
jgi:hypothetical protein